MLTYEELTGQMNQAMLGGQDDRVALLQRVLDALKRPDHRFKIIHIAGTNGKGSTGALIEQTLQRAGFQVGYFSSPAMVDQREQIRINDEMIAKEDFVRTYEQICQQLPTDIQPQQISVFEWWTLIMLQYFADQQVDWAVIECGLGGQDDATNAIDAPAAAVITRVALDHTRILGSTIKEIASAKAGIIKSGTKVAILAPNQDEEVKQIIQQRCRQAEVPLLLADGIALEAHGETVRLRAGVTRLSGHFNLLGTFQHDNLRTATLLIALLVYQGVLPDFEPFTATMATIAIPGRMQVVARHPLTILDGAHNPDAAKRLVETIHEEFADRRLIMVVGFLADKDWHQMIRLYQQVAAKIIVTSPDNHQRALSTAALQEFIPEAQATVDARQGLQLAQEMARPDDIILVTGSFYLIKELES
ncbi:bifunctional folylpolyglutamate synthase/dihydrofolate synthase [Limosilactobacillus kribbianus]|uniref:bifunctional folylpolyglutamate synthase/dihydrofolate synthase n=1 Tax=Limosilactobacillus kribbianus TaxID=2982695 RepID=UPI002263E0A5|nr:cyanophycin synthetase [Limosilactobacillus kribbianus]